MKKQVPLLLLLLLALLPVHAHGATLPVVSTDSILRLHILANSDSETDQAIKLRVRDAVRPLFEARSTYADARTFLLENGALLQNAVQQTLRSCGAAYDAQLSLGMEDFPDRTYDGRLFPAGRYDALIIRLGKGAGHNWWCVLFPPLCIVSDDVQTVDLSNVQLESTVYNRIKEWIAAWHD